ncbi:hypothetical protein LTSEWAN_5682 [Salmonella enterica subsp. enterica serovar Wandsworth str. A4-580]|uniref:Uncharacterized protein n=1 Tax=Salmonella enterica subsp. enterica serovar Wandsworth str. A4-580 TaxID=913086 RepID=G5SIY2_SALET|nr:hypothetical protein LTSEWAN_5682 [Salmonella enterica subsp. enterica serovar Wandsworth str. A4-580]
MPKYRSATTTHGRNMAGARALWRATAVALLAVTAVARHRNDRQ